MPTPFTPYTGSDNTTLTDALLAASSGIAIDPASIVLNASGQDAVNFYDGTLAPLGIGSGLLLTSGTTPGTANTVGWFGQDNSGVSGFSNGDANIDAVVNTVFQTQSFDATTLSFDFTVADPAATSVTFDLVFGSDEFPEWVDQFVDSAIVMVNGVNYALFNHDPAHPLSVVSANLAAGYFQDNAGNVLPIEYDGVSHVLKIVAPIIPGAINHIKIGIADTGDHIYDSGIFLANLSAGSIPGSGVVFTPPNTGSDGSDNVTGTSKDEYFDLKGGDDICYGGAGDDIVVAGAGNDSVFGGSGADQMMGDAGNDSLDGGADADTVVFSGASANYSVVAVGGGFTITDGGSGPTSEGTDTLLNVEFAKFSDGLFAIGPGGVLTPVSDPGTPPSNTPGSVVISGIGSAGKTLTATVSDPDGVPGAISYQWQVSSDDGTTWSDVGVDSDKYTVADADVGKLVQVVASYVDSGSQSESPISALKSIEAVGEGDLFVTLIQLDAPVGASVVNPLTTLVQDAIEFGLSPNTAVLTIATVLGLPVDVDLLAYDSFAVLQSSPSDPTALAVEKIAVEAAILTSLSDDDTGTNLTLKILEAAANNQTLDLADANDLAGILGIDITGIADKNDYPEPLREIFDRNDNIAQATDVGGIETEWQDFLSIQDNVNSTSIADLSVHVNQAPTGVATANLTEGLEDAAYIVSSSDLLQGFSDAENDTLSVSELSADKGAVAGNGDGTFTITPDANYTGPVELTYAVVDGQGGSASAFQLFVIAPSLLGNNAPTGSATAALAAGTEDIAYTVSAASLLAGFSDVDGDALSVSGLSASDGSVADNGDGTFTITPTANFNGLVGLNYDVTDGVASVAATQSYNLDAVNDAPTGSATAALAAGTEDVAYTVSAASLLAGFSDVDGDALSVSGLSASDGSVADNGDGTFTITPTANFNGLVDLNYDVTDGVASVAATQSYNLDAVNDAPAGSATAALAAGTEDVAYTVSAASLLAGFSDVDGDALSVSGLSASDGSVADNGDGTFTITPTANFNGLVDLNYDVTDGIVSVAATQSYTLAPVDDGGGVATTSYILFSQTTTVTGDRSEWGDGGGADSAQGTSAPGNPNSSSSFNADSLGPLGAGAALFDLNSPAPDGGLSAFGTGANIFSSDNRTKLSLNDVTSDHVDLAQSGANWNGIKNLEVKLDSQSDVTTINLTNFVDVRLQIGDDPCAPRVANAENDPITVAITNVKRGEVDGSLADARLEVELEVWTNGFGVGHFQNTFDGKGSVYGDSFIVGAGRVTDSMFGLKSGPGYQSGGTYDGRGTETFTNMGGGDDIWNSSNTDGHGLESPPTGFRSIDKVWGGSGDDLIVSAGGNDILFGDNGSGANLYADPALATIEVDDSFIVGRLNGGVGDPPGFIGGAGGDDLGPIFDAGEYFIVATGGDLMQLRTGPAPHAGGLGIRSADDPPAGAPTGGGDPLGSSEIDPRGTPEAITFDFKTGAHEVEIDLTAFWDNEGAGGTLPEIVEFSVLLADGSTVLGSVTADNDVFPAAFTISIGEADTGGKLIDSITLTPSASDGAFSDFYVTALRACTAVSGADGDDILRAGTGSDFLQGDGDTGEAVFVGLAGLNEVSLAQNGNFIDIGASGGDQLFLGLAGFKEGPGPEDAFKDTVSYKFGDGFDAVREFFKGQFEFEAGMKDLVKFDGGGNTATVTEVDTAEGGSTWISTLEDPTHGVLVVGVTGLVVGTDIIFG